MSLTTTAEDLGIATLSFLASQVGIATLNEVLNVVTGNSEQMLTEDLSQLAGAILNDVVQAIGPDKTKAALQALFAAADKVVDAAENAKFGPAKS
jgi:hypothetical protein